jgi:hypothetical protein
MRSASPIAICPKAASPTAIRAAVLAGKTVAAMRYLGDNDQGEAQYAVGSLRAMSAGEGS